MNLFRSSLLSLLFALTYGGFFAGPAGAESPLTLVTRVPIASKTHDVAVQGSLAYVATEAGLSIVDVTTPASAAVVGSVPASSSLRSQGVTVQHPYAFLAGQTAGLIVVNVSNPAAPTVVATRAVYGGLWDVAVKGSIVYGVSFYGEMYVFNVANPAAPVIAKTIGLPGWGTSGDDVYLKQLRDGVTSGNAKLTGVSVAGNSLFAVDWGYGRLYYYDLSTDPLNPTFAGTHYAPFLIKAEADLARDVVYMLSAYSSVSGLRTVPISKMSPTISTKYTSCPECGFIKSINGLDMGSLAILDSTHVAYAGGKGDGEFHVVDVTIATAMSDVAVTEVGPTSIAMANGMGMTAVGEYIFLAAGALGMQIYHFSADGSPPPPPPPTCTP
jgi:hypothetical protein